MRRGFSVNIPAAGTSLMRIKPDELTALLGAGRYRLAHGREEIDRSISVGRVGRELYPYLICIVALLWHWSICWPIASIAARRCPSRARGTSSRRRCRVASSAASLLRRQLLTVVAAP